MTTTTASQMRSVVCTPHQGSVWTGGAVTLAASQTASSVVLLCKVPNGAVITDWWLHMTTGLATSSSIQLGTSNTPSAIAAGFALANLSLSASVSLDVVTHFPPGNGYRAPKGNRLPVRISLSDDVQPAELWLQMEFIDGNISASAAIRFMVQYTMDSALTPVSVIR